MKVDHEYGDMWQVKCKKCGQPQALMVKGLKPDSVVWCKFCPNKLFFREIERFPDEKEKRQEVFKETRPQDSKVVEGGKA